MRLFSHLWQRVFAYALLLVLVSCVASFLMFRFRSINDMDLRIITAVTSNLVSAIEGKDTASIETLMDFFNNSPRKLWIESPDGKVVVGKRTLEFAYENRASMKPVKAPGSLITVLKSVVSDESYLVLAPIRLKDGDAVACVGFKGLPHPPMSALFLQGLTAACIIGGVLSVWVAWRIARPLRRLRSEVLHIANGNLEARVTERAPKEIAQVANAVNRMAYNLSQNIKGMRELVANLSHEMRSPLARMSISATIIEEGLEALARERGQRVFGNSDKMPRLILDASGTPLACVHIGYVLQEIKHMEKLVSSSLLSSKLDLQHDDLELKTVDISTLCMDIALRHEALLAEKNLAFSLAIQPDVWVHGDETLLSLVVSNLLDNAIKYTDKNGLVRLNLSEQDGIARLCMENSHARLEETILSRLFEPFFRGAGTGDSDGAGLGLTLIKKIAACHNGNASVENCDIGLRFSVSLPCVKREPKTL